MAIMQTITPDEALIGAIYGLYLLSCIHWISNEEMALINNRADEWTIRVITATSYTLLQRMPFIRNPLSTGAGLAVVRKGDQSGFVELPKEPLSLGKPFAITARTLVFRTRSLSFTAAVSGIYLLVVAPFLIYLGLLELLWKPMLSIAVLLHCTVIAEFIFCTRRWRKKESKTFIPAILSILFSPISAVRSADLVSHWSLTSRQKLFESE